MGTEAPQQPVRILLVDDQPLVCAGLAMLLAAQPGLEVVGEAGSGAEGVALAHALSPDVVLMDVRMPGMDGVEATRLIAAARSRGDSRAPRVLVLTSYHVDEAVVAALRAGADGFVLKDAVPDELVSAIRAVAHGEAWLDPAVTRGLLDEFAARPASRLPTPAELECLTNREREVLALAAHGFSNAEIAQQLVVGEATVKTHLGRVMLKLGLRDRAQAVAAAYQTGLVGPYSARRPSD